MKPSPPITPLPPSVDLQTVPVLRAVAQARAALGELKGRAASLPNPEILLNTLFLQEALASSEIENIVTTQDEAFRAGLFSESGSPQAKEVARYRQAMYLGYEAWQKNNLISENMLIEMCRLLKKNSAGYRKTAGTILRNVATGEDVHIPPQDEREIIAYMRDLANFINDESLCDWDPLIKMALIHHQFESIHPFYDGNGRVGRILNVLYLTHTGLLDAPILYLSRAINNTKADYYRLLQSVRENGEWEEWVLYMLRAVTETAATTLQIVSGIRDLMAQQKFRLRDEHPKIYSQDLLNNLFRHPYTRIEYVMEDLKVTRLTARKYLKTLAENGFVLEEKVGRNNYYVNNELVNLFWRLGGEGTNDLCS